MTVAITVNLLPTGNDLDALPGSPLYISGAKFRIEELNEWHWLHVRSPRGIALSACFDPAEREDWVDGAPASTDGLSRQDRTDWLRNEECYRLRGKFAWLHHEPGGPTICTWLAKTRDDIEHGVRASRRVDDYLADGADPATTATMVSLASGAGVFFA